MVLGHECNSIEYLIDLYPHLFKKSLSGVFSSYSFHNPALLWPELTRNTHRHRHTHRHCTSVFLNKSVLCNLCKKDCMLFIFWSLNYKCGDSIQGLYMSICNISKC